MKPLLIFLVLLLILSGYWLLNRQSLQTNQLRVNIPTLSELKKPDDGKQLFLRQLRQKANTARIFAVQKGFSTRFAFLIDMSLPSGKNRFFVYDAMGDSILIAGLVAHGSCRTRYLQEALFSNTPDCGCSSVGKYKIGYGYQGQYSWSFKLHGLDSTNSNAYQRLIVLHAYSCVPDTEVDPLPICNSLGCTMVSPAFLQQLAAVIKSTLKPILMWVYN